MKARCALMLLLTGLVCSGCSSRQDYVAASMVKPFAWNLTRNFTVACSPWSTEGHADRQFISSETIVANGASVSEFHYVRQTSEETDASGMKQKSFYLTGRNGQILRKSRSPSSMISHDGVLHRALHERRPIGPRRHAVDQQPLLHQRTSCLLSPFWSYQAAPMKTGPTGSFRSRPVQPGQLHGYERIDYGGGTPVSDVWRKDIGIGVGSVETVPRLISLPVAMPGPDRAELGFSAMSVASSRRGIPSRHTGPSWQCIEATTTKP